MKIIFLLTTLLFINFSFSQTTYTFTGNGNWTDSSNWVNRSVPPASLATGTIIYINPITDGECVLDVLIKIPSGVSLNVQPGKRLRVQGNIVEVDHLRQGLVAYYPFNGNAKDESGNNYDLTVNRATLTSNRFNENAKSYHFNGTSSYMTIPSLPKASSLNELTISVWIRPVRFSSEILMFKANNSLDECASYIGISSRGSINNYSVSDGIVTDFYCTTARVFDTSTFSFGQWNHFVLVQYPEQLSNGNTIFRYSVYNNGVKSLYSTSQYSYENPSPTTFNYGGTIGSYINGRSYFFEGEIDDVRIYDRRLSDDEVSELYNLKY